MSTELTTDVQFEKALSNSNAYNQAMTVAKSLARSNFIPATFKNNEADCLIALIMSEQLKVNPVTLMQEMYIVHGKPAFSAKFAISMANNSGVFKDKIAFETKGSGDSLEATAFATLKNGTKATATVSMAMVKAEKWDKNPKYKTMPEHMLRYRAATFLVKQYCPEVLMGFHTDEEIKDTYQAPIEEKKNLLESSLGIEPEPEPEPEIEAIDAEPVSDLDERVSKMLGWFSELPEPQDEAQVLDFLDRESVSDITEEDLIKLKEVDVKIKASHEST